MYSFKESLFTYSCDLCHVTKGMGEPYVLPFFFLLYHNNMEVVNLLVRMPNVTPLGHINYRMRHKKYFQNGVVFISKFSYFNS